ncbi:arylsulfatase [Albibacterium indicum]|uniref:arylsulfatase n=1 Tax=Albibacterium indicum TaxID=2292082 RepID=UPI000E47F1C7|nr:arylsulfatase [Pedobacter indicus]
MKNTFCIIILSLCCLAFSYSQNNSRPQTSRPNIIIIMADDLGYSDLGCYGGEVETPNIDFLAREGVRFKQFYNTSRCCPSRAALLTGQYNHMAGIGEMTTATDQPGYQGHLTDNSVTLAEVLKDAGYQTAMVGKWHVSNTIVQNDPKEQLKWLNHQTTYPLFSPIDQYPTRRGFEKYFGTIWGVVDFFDPFSLVNGEQAVENVPEDYYHTDALNDTAVAYIESFSNEEPFFMYLAHNAPHWPLQAVPEDIAKYEDTYKVGWQAIREQRYQRMVKLGLIDPETEPLSDRMLPEEKWDENPNKEWDAHAMAVHAAMIDRMDQGIGRIINKLKERGILDNTVIFFLSDNGASPENAMRYGPGFDRPSETRTGETIHYPVDKAILPGPQTTFTSIGPNWANVANTPWREAKEQSFEGGVRTPMIAFLPKSMMADRGSINQQHVGHIMDFMNTLVEVAGASYPKTHNGHQISPSTGLSMVDALNGKETKGHEDLFNEHFNAKYARIGNWKLVMRPKADSKWELYNLDTDATETKNLALVYPEKVKELSKRWKVWAEEHQVFPKP